MSKFCFACHSSKTSGSVCCRRSVGVCQPALKWLAEVALTRVNWCPLKGHLKSSGIFVAPDFCHTPFRVPSTSQRMSTISASFFSYALVEEIRRSFASFQNCEDGWFWAGTLCLKTWKCPDRRTLEILYIQELGMTSFMIIALHLTGDNSHLKSFWFLLWFECCPVKKQPLFQIPR